MSSDPGARPARLAALQDRAYAFIVQHQPVAEPALLAHTYGGHLPPALHAQLAEPLLDDPRLERGADGSWTVRSRRAAAEPGGLLSGALTTLAVATSGPTPGRGRVVRVAAEHNRAAAVIERFTATLNPGVRVPGYVAERLGLAPSLFDDLPSFVDIVDDLVEFLGGRPVLAQDARLSWAFLEAEMRRSGRIVVEPLLVDANVIATRLLGLQGKPSLGLVANRLGIGTVGVARPEEEARVLGQLATRLLTLAGQQGFSTWAAVLADGPSEAETTLRRGHTARSLPDEPGVYVLRDTEQTPLYIGKARRLRSRVADYINRPIGATRRLEGLVGAVHVVDSTVCATDLEALVLEDREIRRLRPRFNTVRQQRAPRLWIRLPPPPVSRPGRRQPALRRLEASLGPSTADGEFVGPFRNEMLARQARALVREVFELDALRRGNRELYADRLRLAWDMLRLADAGSLCAAEAFARQRSSRVLRAVLEFDLAMMLLPADPREARYAVVRPGPTGIEGFVVDRGFLRAWSVLADDDATRLASDLLFEAQTATEPRTGPQDVDVVLRWMGAQRPPAQLVHLPAEPLAAADAIDDAVLALLDRLAEA